MLIEYYYKKTDGFNKEDGSIFSFYIDDTKALEILYDNKKIHINHYIDGLRGNVYSLRNDWQNYKYLQDYFFEDAKMEFDSYTARGIDPLKQDSRGETELSKYKTKQKVKSPNENPIEYIHPIKKLANRKTLNDPNSKPSSKVKTLTKKNIKGINKLSTKIAIKFVEKTHQYYVNGKKVISVSEFIDRYSSNLNIYNDYANVPSHVLRRAALKGEALHKEIEDYEKTGYESGSVEFYNYKKIKQKLKFSVKHSEIMVAIKNSSGDFVAAGRLDMLVTFGTKVGIIDIKRTWKFYRDKVTAQVNLYRLGLLHTYGITASELICIRLRETIAENHIIKNDESNIMKVLDLI